jgi:tRNA A-37 threonylcarbamoyl transferase component Bud32
MVGFKSNKISVVPEHSLPKNIRWLILTDNRITALPESIGEYTKLQKLMLAGNQIKHLPKSMVNCTQLELFRISANQLEALPTWLFTLPKLAWLAFAGNPCLNHQETQPTEITQVSWDKFEIKQVLGEGASGTIFQAAMQGDMDIAVKVFKGDVTSDGYPADEHSASTVAGKHKHLIEVIGQLTNHPEQKDGLLLSYIPDTYQNLGNPPSLATCTRDTYHESTSFTTKGIIDMMSAIASVAHHLHQKNISHGDLYAHNILINEQQHCYLGDFGAATIYTNIDSTLKCSVEALEVKAFGCLLDDLLLRSHDKSAATALHQLKDDCLQTITSQRPSFASIQQILKSIQASQEV